MKIQCDVCNKAEAVVFCTADEAALCCGCDHRVHHANKLASKHQRFSLLSPSPKQFPLCDICQEKRAFLFCQQDRAILCRECDHPIHSANEHTQKHSRFFLTGLKLSSSAELYQVSGETTDPKAPSVSDSSTALSHNKANGFDASFSISEYLIETLPGWHVEDLLDNNTNSSSFGISKMDEAVFVDCDLENSTGSHSNMNMAIWVPQAPSPLVYPSEMGKVMAGFKDGNNNCNKDYSASLKSHNGIASARRWSDDGSFTVPQINLPSVGSKRSRAFW